MEPLNCPLGTSWCTDHEPADARDNWANASGSSARLCWITARPRRASGPARTTARQGKLVISVRQFEGDSTRVEVDWPDSTADFPGVEWWTPREAREIGAYLVEATDLLELMT